MQIKQLFTLILTSLILSGCISNDFYILTPQEPETPLINSAQVFGVRPDNPFHFKVAATGKAPLTYRAENLPGNLKINADNGIITGTAPEEGSYTVKLIVSNELGSTEQLLTIKAGEQIGLTPVMGWNSWYIWSESVSQEKILRTATAMKDSGLVNYGWSYINIDDCWQGERGGKLNAIQGNERFPDMKKMCTDIHNLGLKTGIYSTPWIGSYAGFTGSTGINAEADYSSIAIPVEQRLQPGQIFGRSPNVIELGLNKVGEFWYGDKDALQWAEWGFDLVKFDWNPIDIRNTQKIYQDLRNSGRDMILSLSNNAQLDIAQELTESAQYWRISGDIEDTWSSIERIVKKIIPWQKYAGPGHFNDADMLQVGKLGVPNTFVKTTKPTRLTADQQYSQVSYWALFAAPMIISCDLEDMDKFTLNLLCNREINAINQDSLGIQGKIVKDTVNHRIIVKPLSNGAKAIGIFNKLGIPVKTTINLNKCGLTPENSLRDAWRQKDLGSADENKEIQLRPYGCYVFTVK